MRNCTFILSLVIVFVGFYSCHDSEPDPELDVKPSVVVLDANNSGSFSIACNTSWTIALKGDAAGSSWLTYSQNSGVGNTDVMVGAKEDNTTLEQRSQELTVTAGNIVRTVTVRQNALPKLEVDSVSISFNAEGGTNSFGIISNHEWTVQSNQEWCAVGQTAGEKSATIIVNADSNESLDSREAEITVAGGNFTYLVKVIQAGAAPFINVEEENVNFDAKAGSKKLVITSNTPWTAKSSDTSWCTVSSESSNGEESVIISVKENPTISERKAIVTLEGDGVTKEIEVVQGEGDGTLTVSKTECSFSREAGSSTFSITSNMKWTVASSQQWCTVDKTSGEGNASSVKISVTKNDVEAERTAIVTVTGEKNNIKREIKVTQAKKGSLDVDVESMAFEANGGSKTCNVTSDISWSATSNFTWCTVSPTSGSNSKTLTVKAAENTSLSERNAIVTISGEGISRTINVTQKAGKPFLTVSASSMSFSSQSGSNKVDVLSNIGWTATSDQSWCTLGQNSGNGSSSLYVYVSANTSSSDRTATVTLTSDRDNIVRTITVYQEKETWLTVSPTSVSMQKNGGSQTISVTSNNVWTASSNQSWCSLSKTSGTGNGSFTINASSNSTIYSRNATVTIKAGDKTRTVSVSQEENISITLSSYSLSIYYLVGSSYFTLSCDPNLSWYIKEYTSNGRRIVIVNPSKGKGSDVIDVWSSGGTIYDTTTLYIYTSDDKLRATVTVTYRP